MAESPFLKWQDQDGDGLIDVCDDLLERPDMPVCLNCTPNPSAIVPDWKKLRVVEPFLNEKICEYQVTKVTPHKTTADPALLEDEDANQEEIRANLRSRFDEYVEEAIESMLDFYDKDDSEDSRAKVRDSIRYLKYDLPPRPNSRLKLLYSVPFDTIYELPQRAPEPEEPEADPLPGEMKAKYNAGDLSTKMIRIRKALNLYDRYLKVYRAIDGGNIMFKEDDRVFNLGAYGDSALFSSSRMSSLLDVLESWFNSKGYQMPGVGGITFFKDTIVNVEFRTNNYKLNRIRIWTEGCGEKPIVFGKRRLRPLLMNGAWKDVTAVAYLMQAHRMESDITARVPPPWQEFIVKYTYPKVYSTLDKSSPESTQNVWDCITDALANEAKQFGQDLLDEVFGLGDAIAYLFHKNICRWDASETRADWIDMGLMPGPDVGMQGMLDLDPDNDGKLGIDPANMKNFTGGVSMNKANLMGMAQMQAFKELDAADQVFAQMCGRMLANMIGWGPAQRRMDQMWEYGFERIKQCGLFDLMMEAIKCLLGGLDLDEALGIMLGSALRSMGIENFGQLFVGLPAEKQTELANLALKKLESGDFIKDQRERAVLQSQGIGLTSAPRPWENQAIIDREREVRAAGGSGDARTGFGAAEQQQASQTRRTLAQQFDVAGSAEEQLNPDDVMEAYFLAIIEIYSDNFLALVDLLNKFPGAPIIAGILAMFDCPRPPLFNPSILDFLQDIELPWCRNKNEIRIPRLENPFIWVPKVKDITWLLWQLIKFLVMQLVMTILIKLMVKICQIIGDAICAALRTGGDILMAMPQILGGTKTLSDVIKESICGPQADDQQVEDTIVQIMTSLGPGGAAMADRDQTLRFAEDLSSSVTRQELIGAILGNPSQEFTEVISQLIEFEYPEYASALPDNQAIGDFFGNIGNLMPLDFRQELGEVVRELPENELMPANPTLCASPEHLEAFKELRCELLEGRASKEQCDVMYDNLRTGFLEDLETLTSAMQGDGIPGFIQNNMPPLVSSAPGCSDGLIPPVSDAEIAVASQALGNDFEQLKIAFAKDMMGNGSFWNGDAEWGFINMVMSDTQGNPLTAHYRKTHNNKDYVNFATNLPNGGEAATGFFSFLQSSAGFSSQHGQFPHYVAEWTMRQFLNVGVREGLIDAADYNPNGGLLELGGLDLAYGGSDASMKFVSHNSVQTAKKTRVTFDEMDFNTWSGSGVDLLKMPDFGYNVRFGVDFDDEYVTVTRRARKGGAAGNRGTRNGRTDGADIYLDYKDNAAGMRETGGRGTDGDTKTRTNWLGNQESTWSYGFDIQMFFSDIIQVGNSYLNRPDDNCRIQVTEKVNWAANVESPFAEQMTDELEKSDAFDLPPWIENVPIVGWALQNLINLIMYPFSHLVRPKSASGIATKEGNITRMREFEFLAVDDGLDYINMSDFPKLNEAFNSKQQYTPQLVALAELLGGDPGALKTSYDNQMTKLFARFATEIGTNTTAFLYGAEYDYLTPSSLIYLAPMDYQEGRGSDPLAHEMIQVYDSSTDIFGSTVGWRDVESQDMILGISYDQWMNERAGTPENTRVFYLDPAKFGGSYMEPPLYIKPLKQDGWMGIIDAIFPEYTPCKPHNTDLLNFDDIKKKIDERYTRIPDDPRLKGDPDCAVEVPYNRIMNRPARAAMGGLIEGAIRIYASVHFFKAIGTFSKIMPKFPENYSNLYAAYIVEVMEEAFKDVQADFWETFNPFKDSDFWYAFLEQSVQYYAWLVDDGEITDPPRACIDALQELNDIQEEYDFPWWDDWWEAVKLGDTSIFQGLKGYRLDKNFEAVQRSDELSKLILTELVNVQLTFMGEQLVSNLRSAGFNPTIFDLDFWLFENMCADTEGMLHFAGPKLVERPVSMPTKLDPDPTGEGYSYPGPYYTAGGQFRIAAHEDTSSTGLGEEYVGYYHIETDAVGDEIYVAGENPSDDVQPALTLVNSLIEVGTEKYVSTKQDIMDEGYSRVESAEGNPPGIITEFVGLGDIPEYGSTSFDSDDKPFYIEKYISVDGVKMTTTAAQAAVQANGDRLISEVYPGTMKLIYGPKPRDAAGNLVPGELEPIGIEGNLGVRYGIQFYYGAAKTPITSVEVDALDFACKNFNPSLTNNKLLWCLLNKLKNDGTYKMMTSYIFPMKKVTAALAIYNDMSFLSAVGEVTVADGDAYRWVPTGPASALFNGMVNTKSKTNWLDPMNGDYGETWAKRVQSKPGAVGYLHEEEHDPVTVEDPWWGWMGETYEMDVWLKRPDLSGTSGNEGWQHYDDRQPGFFGGLWVCEWDNWDRVILRKSKSKIKNMFRAYYNSRTFTPGDSYAEPASSIFIKNLKARLKPSPGAGLLSWSQRGRTRSNPFNAHGELCDGKN